MKAGKSAVIILAAGFSSRMQTFKPLMEIGGKSLVERLINTYTELSIDIYVVTGWHKEELQNALAGYPLQIVENPDYASGMFSSIQAGLRYIQGSSYQCVLIQPVDIPLVRRFSVQSILNRSKQRPGKIIYPVFQGKRGHPPLIPLQFISKILDWKDSGGLKACLERFNGDAIDLPVADAYIQRDVDNPDEYQKILEDFSRYTIPTFEECDTILTKVRRVPAPIYDHCTAVVDLAVQLAVEIKKKIPTLNQDAIRAAASLHDLAKGRADHADSGAKILSEMGFCGVSDMVAQHTDLESSAQVSLESKIVYLADKYILGNQRVDLEARYQQSSRKFGSSPEIEAKINQRRAIALRTKQDLENILGHSLDKIIFPGTKSFQL